MIPLLDTKKFTYIDFAPTPNPTLFTLNAYIHLPCSNSRPYSISLKPHILPTPAPTITPTHIHTMLAPRCPTVPMFQRYCQALINNPKINPLVGSGTIAIHLSCWNCHYSLPT